MALGTADLQILINAKDDASKTFGKVGKTIGKFSKLAVLGAGAAAVAAAGATVAAVKMAQGYEKAMAEVASLGVPVDQMKVLEDGVLDLSKRLGVDATEATGALYQAISAGVPPENALAFLETASKAAIAGVTSAEVAVDGISSVVNAFASQNLSATEASDLLFATVKAGKTNFEELSASIANVAPLANATGVSFAEVSASLATMTASGTATSVATTQVRSAIQALTKPSQELTDIFQAAGFASGEAAVRQVGFAKAADIVSKATGGSVAGMTKLLGSIEGVQGVLGVTGDQAKAFAKNMDGMTNSAGAADEAFGVMSQTFDFQMSRVRQAFKSGMIEFGLQILPILTPIAEMMANKLPRAIEIALKPLKAFGGAMGSISESFSIFMIDLDDLWSRFEHGGGILSNLNLEFKSTGDAFMSVHDVFPQLTGAMGVLNQAYMRFRELLITLRPSFEYLREAIKPIEQSFRTLGETVGFSFQTMMDSIKPMIPVLVNMLLPAWVRLLGLVGKLLPVLQEFGAAVIPVIVESINKLTAAWETFFGGPESDPGGSTMLQNLIEQGKELAKEFAANLVPVIRGLADQFVAIIPVVAEFTKNTIAMLVPMVQQLFRNIELLVPTLKMMWATFKLNVDMIGQQLQPTLQALGALFQESMMPLIEAVVSLIGTLMGTFQRLLPPIMEIFKALAEHVVPVLQFVISEVLPPVLALLTELIKQVEAQLVPAFEQMVKALAEAVVPAVKLVSQFIIFLLKHALLPTFTYLHEYVRPALVAIAIFILNTLTKAFKLIAALLKGDFAGALRFARDLVVHIIQGMAGAIFGIVNLVIGRIKNIVTSVKGAIFDVMRMVKNVPIIGKSAQALTKVLGFQHGGQFTVGGAGGADSQVVQFAATPGEIVTVTPPNRASGGGGGMTVVVQGSLVTERELSEIIVGTMREATRLNEDVLNVNTVTI